MKRPLVVTTVGYIIGIVWGLYCNCSIALLYAIIFPISYLIKLYFKSKKKFKLFSIKRYFRYVKLFIKFNIIIVIIISSFISSTVVINQNKKYNNLYLDIKDVNLTGIIVSNLQKKETISNYKIKVETLNNSHKFKDTYLILNIKNNNYTTLEYGDRVIIKGEFIKPHIQRNYKGFDYKEFLKTKKIYGSINVSNTQVIGKNCTNCVFMTANTILMHIKNRIQETLPNKYSNLLIAIMLGDSLELDKDIKQNFRDSSIAHILSVSGMHIAYIVLGITIIFNKFLGKRKSKIITIIILITYMFITGFIPSVVRATIMTIIFMISKIIYRKNDTWSSISFTILCMLIYNPFYIYNTGVLLSFGGIIGIAIFSKNIHNILDKIKIKNIKYKYKIKKIEKLTEHIKDTLSITIAVQIIIMPILVNYFNTINILFIITNILLGLIAAPIVIFGFLFIITSLVNSSQIFLYPMILLLQLLITISKIGNNLPLNKIHIKPLNLFQIILYYFLIFTINFIYKIYMSKVPSSFEYRIRNIISLLKYKFRKCRRKIISVFLIICIFLSINKTIPQKLKIYFNCNSQK